MNRWKFIAILLLIACLCLAAFWGVTAYRLAQTEETVNEYVKKELKDKDFQEGEYEKPDIPDAPEGSKPLLHVTGKVRYPRKSRGPQGTDVQEQTPVVGVTPLDVTAAPPTPEFPRGNPCSLDDLDVEIRCTVDAMQEPGKPWARLLVSGQIEGWDQVRILEEQPSGSVELQVTPKAKPKAWGLNFMAGAAIGSRNGIEAGFSGMGKKRLGWYSLVEYQYATGGTAYDAYRETTYSTGSPATWRIHGGIVLRLK